LAQEQASAEDSTGGLVAAAMKPLARVAHVLLLSPLVSAVMLQRSSSGSSSNSSVQAPRAVTEVVNLLQTMLDKAQTEAEDERKLYAEYKCYCDDNEKEKTEAIATATKNIQLLESDIEGLLGSNAELSQEVATLKQKMAANEKARTDGQTMRDSEETAYLKEKADLEAAIGQLSQAIGALAAIGADQSMASQAHTNFMAGYGSDKAAMLGLTSSLRQAMLASSAWMQPSQRQQVEVLLQAKAPFTGTYVTQSGEVFGILKQMNETFSRNLEEATSAEQAAVTAFGKWKADKLADWNTMDQASTKKANEMGTNDGDLSTKRGSLETEKQTKADSEAFLEQLLPMCKEKAKDYEQRVMWRTKEQAVISEAIAVLNSDHAFDSFGKVTATSFLQVSDSRAKPSGAIQRALAAKPVTTYLQQAAHIQHSSRLAHVAHMLAVGNPFEKVLEEIKKMKTILAAEAQQDVEAKEWCVSERANTQSSIDTKNGEIQTLKGEIDQLVLDIDHPDTGLKAVIKENEDNIAANLKSMTDETANRRTENVEYQQKVAECVEAAAILKSATNMLKKFYDQFEKEKRSYYTTSLVQEEPAPPATWEGEYQDTRASSGGDIMSLLGTIHDNTVAEETALHRTEMEAQHSFEDFMQQLTSQNEEAQSALVTAKKSLAEKQLELGEKRAEKDNTEKQVIELERYLEQIKPGCDFITDNFDTRKTNRAAEVAALDLAVTKIQDTPAYKQMESRMKQDSWGNCKEICLKDEQDVKCKACLKDISVPGYCAANPSTAGC